MEVNVTPVNDKRKARKRQSNPNEWKREKQKRLRYGPKELPIYPTCGHNMKAYQCTALTMKDIQNFHQKFYEKKEKLFQDNFILKFSSIHSVKRKRPKNETHKSKEKNVKCYILDSNKKLVPVCKRAFMEVLGVTRRRIDTVTKNFLATSLPPIENRGGDRKTKIYENKKRSVMSFINKLHAVESHYCRSQNNSERLYLPSDLNIKMLWKAYSNDPETLPVKHSYFRHIFNTRYNLGFGTPRTDVCSTCLQLSEKIKSSTIAETRTNFIVEKRLHKLRAKAYFDLLREQSETMITFSFDCEKNQLLPKLPDQEAYYSHKIYLYNFTVVQGHSHAKLGPSTVKSFCWTENEYAKGSNEISSCLNYVFETTDLSNIQIIRLMCDGCGGQNKNTTLVGMCSHWLLKHNNQSASSVARIEIIFPIRGHSFIPPDRVFGNMEKEIKKLEIIKKPEEYHDIFSKFSTVLKLGRDVQVFEWKQAVAEVVKPTSCWHFRFAQAKRIIITKDSGHRILVRGETTYRSDLGAAQSICKRGRKLQNIVPSIIEKQNKIKEKKVSTITALLKAHYGEQWRENEQLQFYKFVLEEGEKQQDMENEEIENLCESFEEGPNVRV